MQKVEGPYPFVTPPAARLEDRTQPMGPLEEGDQALVDAAHKLPAGEYVTEQDGVRTRVLKDEGVGRDQVIATTTTPDGTIEQAGTLIDSIPQGSIDRVGPISAGISLYPAGETGGKTIAEASGNEVGSVFNAEYDRPKAQAIKLEVAREIDAATQRLEEGRVDDPALAAEMAEAEKPHRDEIAERKRASTLAAEMADVAMSRTVDPSPGALPSDMLNPKLQASMLRDVSERANRKDMERAESAARAAREAHEAGNG